MSLFSRSNPKPITPVPASVGRSVGGNSENIDISADLESMDYQIITDIETNEEIRLYGKVFQPGGQEPSPSHDQARFCAYTNQGELFYTDSGVHSPQFTSFEGLLKRRNFPIRPDRRLMVSRDILKQIYAHGAVAGNFQERAGQDTAARRNFLNMVQMAAEYNASDIHITQERARSIQELRIDGNMRKQGDLDYNVDAMMRAAYTLADISDTGYQPFAYQYARIAASKNVELPPNVQALRVQWNPLANQGRYMVVRLLYTGSRIHQDIDKLGYSAGHLALIKHMRQFPTGINIFSGPTGSGKSTTLKTALQALIRERMREINVITVEDPPEYVIEGAKQMPVTEAKTTDERSQAFQEAIRASLRSDPNVLMIGEIRDAESARLAFTGAMTGHQIWTTLHTNSAIDIIARLREIGVDRSLLHDEQTVRGLVGQRLIQRLCVHCRVPLSDHVGKGSPDRMVDTATAERAQLLCSQLGLDPEPGSKTTLYHRGAGCKECGKGRGYNGRTVVAEIIIPDLEFMERLNKEGKSSAREYWLSGKMAPLAGSRGASMVSHSVAKMLRGEVSAADVEREVGLLIYHESMDELFKNANEGKYDPIVA